ncbi:SDR family NAD(P)-dependent oxidoreductase [Paraconexibacter sp. AEG42_29]
MDVTGRTVLLTGATGGIGHAIARRLHAAGAVLVLTGRRAEVLEPLAAELGATAVACDLADPAAIDALVAAHPDVDVVVNNAALPASGPLSGFTPAQVDRAMQVNLRAPIAIAHFYASRMTTRSSGHLVFISSLSGKSAAPGTSLYSASKFGMRGFAWGLREDLHGTGVGVSTVFPGFIRDAGMFADSGAVLPKGVGSATPEQVADAVLRAIRKDKAEIDVAPVSLRVGAAFAGVAPQLSASVSRRLGASDISSQIAAGQADKR